MTSHKQDLFRDIEGRRGSKVITYMTGDGPGLLNARVAMDVIPLFSKHLRKLGRVSKIDLFLFSQGGDTMVPWRLVSMIREYCDRFSVLVPYKCHSAATMIALGADEIVMSDLSELSPIDPSTVNPFNPSDPNNPNAKIAISVEDVVSYMALARDKFNITGETELSSIYKKFVEADPPIHPLALGNINRSHNLIRLLAKRLLRSHVERMSDEEMEKIVEYFTEKLHSHQYFIGRREAKEELGLKTIVDANPDLARVMTELYDVYAEEMQLGRTMWKPESEIEPNAQKAERKYTIAAIETAEASSFYRSRVEFVRQQNMVTRQTPQGPVQLSQEQIGFVVPEQGWVIDF